MIFLSTYLSKEHNTLEGSSVLPDVSSMNIFSSSGSGNISLPIKIMPIVPLTYSYTLLKCTIPSKINVTPKGVNLPISKLHSILAVAIYLSINNISQICYIGQISLQSAAVNCRFSYNLTPFGVTFILLVTVFAKVSLTKGIKTLDVIMYSSYAKYINT